MGRSDRIERDRPSQRPIGVGPIATEPLVGIEPAVDEPANAGLVVGPGPALGDPTVVGTGRRCVPVGYDRARKLESPLTLALENVPLVVDLVERAVEQERPADVQHGEGDRTSASTRESGVNSGATSSLDTSQVTIASTSGGYCNGRRAESR